MSVKEKIVSFRVTDEEFKWLKELAGNTKLSDLIREKVLSSSKTYYYPETGSYSSNPMQGTFLINGHEPSRY